MDVVQLYKLYNGPEFMAPCRVRLDSYAIDMLKQLDSPWSGKHVVNFIY